MFEWTESFRHVFAQRAQPHPQPSDQKAAGKEQHWRVCYTEFASAEIFVSSRSGCWLLPARSHLAAAENTLENDKKTNTRPGDITPGSMEAIRRCVMRRSCVQELLILINVILWWVLFHFQRAKWRRFTDSGETRGTNVGTIINVFYYTCPSFTKLFKFFTSHSFQQLFLALILISKHEKYDNVAPSVRRIISWQHSESEFQILCSFHSFLTHCLIFFLGSINIRAAIRIICCHFNTSENHEDVHICACRAKNDNISTTWVTFELHTVASRWRSREDGGRVTVRLDSCQARDNWFCKGEITGGSGHFPAVIVRQNQVLYAKTWSCCCFLSANIFRVK